MRRHVKTLSIVVCIVGLFWLLLQSSFKLSDGSKNKIQDLLSHAVGQNTEISIKGPIRLELLPYPRLIGKELIVRQAKGVLLKAKQVDIRLSSCLLMHYYNNNLTACALDITLDSGHINAHQLNNISSIKVFPGISELLELKLPSAISSLRARKFQVFTKSNILSSALFLPRFNITQGVQGLKLDCDLIHGGAKGSVQAHLRTADEENLQKAELRYKSDALKVEMSLLQASADKSTVTGKMLVQINDFVLLKKFIATLYELENSAKPELVLVSLDPIQIAEGKPGLTIVGDLSFNNNLLSFYNLNTGDSDPVLDARLTIDSAGDGLDVYGYFRANELNFNSEASHQQLKAAAEICLMLTKSKPSFLTPDLNIKIDSNIREISLLHEKLLDFNLFCGIADNEVFLDSMTARLPHGSYISITGSKLSSSMQQRFQGSVNFESMDIAKFLEWSGLTSNLNPESYSTLQGIKSKSFLTGDVELGNGIIRLYNAHFASEALNLNGVVVFDYNDGSSLRIQAESESLDMNSFGVARMLESFKKLLFTADSDTTGETYFRGAQNHSWLRGRKSKLFLELTAKNCIIGNTILKELKISTEASNNKLRIYKLSFNSPNIGLVAGGSVTLPGLRPDIQSKIRLEYLTTDVHQLSQDPTAFNFFSLWNFDGNHSISYDIMRINSKDDLIVFQDGAIHLRMINGAIVIDEANGRAFDGWLKLVGYAMLKQRVPQFNLQVSMDNINPGPLLKILTGLNKLEAKMSISARFRSTGKDWDSIFAQNLEGTAAFIGRRIYWSGLSLDEIVESVDSNQDLKSRIEIANNAFNSGTSYFDELEGMVSISRNLASVQDVKMSNSRLSGVYVANYDYVNRNINSVGVFGFIPVGKTKSIRLEFDTSGNLPNNYRTEVKAEDLTAFFNEQNNLSQGVQTQSKGLRKIGGRFTRDFAIKR